MKIFLLVVVWVLFIQSLFADIPTGYYDSADGLTGNALKSALHDIIDDHTEKTYTDLWTILKESDEDPDNSNNFILIYTGRSIPKTSTYPDFNREHVWAKSHGDFGNIPPAGTDAHHIRPADESVNSDRSDLDFDNGGTQHPEATECYYDSDSWEPRDAVKGDVARMMFYMAVRYEGDVAGEPDLELVDHITTYYNPEFGILSTLLEWHNQDPVDDFERNRNEVVYSYQNNRNPFIDHPEYVVEIWGSGGNSLPSVTEIEHSPTNPTSSDAVTVTATITDSDGTISNAEFHWGLSSGSLTNIISMSVSSGDTYSTDTEIPAQTDGTTVYYEIEATDDDAETNTTSEQSYIVDDNAAIAIIDEDFTSLNDNDEITLTDWLTIPEVGSRDWIGKVYNTDHYIQATAYLSSDASNVCWVLTPEVNFNNYTDELLSFKSAMAYWNHDGLSIWIVQNLTGEDISNATKTEITATLATQNSGDHNWVESGNIDLSTVSGVARIAFKYEGSATASETTTFRIDDVLITGIEATSNETPEITDISHSPTSPLETDDVTISATITDSDGTITSANIKWGTTSGSHPNTMSMSNTGDTYSGVIPAQTGGTTVCYVIEATDNDSESSRSTENSFSFNTTGNEVPQITNVSFNPTDPESTESVSVSATITDSDGTISSAIIKWGTSTGNYPNDVNMSPDNGDYSGTIPAQADGTEVFFIIEAEDNEAGVTTSAEHSYNVYDPANNPPGISDVAIDPENPTENDNVTISALVSDTEGSVESVVLKWKQGSSDYSDVNMNISGGRYYGQIPKQTIGKTVYFSIIAEDNEGLEGSYTDGSYEISESSGINSFSQKDLKIYPNPTSDKINIEFAESNFIKSVKVYNLIGEKMLEMSNLNAAKYTIELSCFPKGIYILQVDDSKNSIVRKVMLK